DEDPGKEEMHDAPSCEVAIRWNGDGRGKAAILRRLRRAADTQVSRGVKVIPEDPRPPLGTVRRVDSRDPEHGVFIREAALVAEVKRRMSVEYLQAGEKEKEPCDRPRPVRKARQDFLPVDERPLGPGRARIRAQHG